MTTTAIQGGVIPQWRICDRLRRAREYAGLEQSELARLMGVSRQTVGNNERGSVATRRIVLNAWALATGVSVQWLETGQDPTNRPGPDAAVLPRLDSNQQPSAYPYAQVRALHPLRLVVPAERAA